MLELLVLWISIGGSVGLIARAARWRPHWRWFALVGIGICAACMGWWIGEFVWGRYFASITAVWVAIVSVIAVPHVWEKIFPSPRHI